VIALNIHAILDASLTGKNMATTDSQYNYGRFNSAKLAAEDGSKELKTGATGKPKPDAVTHSRPLEAISQRAMQVLATLPSSFQMHETRRTYPHVMNMIADAWHDPEFLFHVVRNLLIDQRGGRAGFQFSVLAEITNLREYYFTSVRPEVRAKYNRDL
jgi:hypothetical protein